MGASTPFATELATAIRGGTPYTAPAQWRVALFTGDTNLEAGQATDELFSSASNGYARQNLTFQDVAGQPGWIENTAEITFAASGGNWPTCTHGAAVAGATVGANDIKAFGPIASFQLDAGSSVKFPAGSIRMRIL